MKASLFPIAVSLIGLITSSLGTDCPIVPEPKEYAPLGGAVELGTPETAAIVANPSDGAYAARRLQALIQNRFKRTIPINPDGKRAQSFVLTIQPAKPARANEFRIDFNESSISVTGSDKLGLAYGVEALFSLIHKHSDGVVRITKANVRDWPSIPWRGRPHSVMAQQLLPGQLDAYVHSRLNFIDYRDNPGQKESVTMPARKSSMGCPPGKPIAVDLCRKVLGTYHDAGFFVYGVVSCALPEGDYSRLGQTFDELLKLGCDGIWVSMDDTGGGSDPVKLAEYAAQYMRKTGKTGHDACFTPGAAEYTTIDKPLNRAMAKIPGFNGAVWIFTRVPCKADYELCKEIGLKDKPAWWFNYCETRYPDPKAGFIHSSAILTSQRKDGGLSYMNLLPITPGWGYPEFDKIRDAANYTSQVNLWALCGGWPAEYALVMFGNWAWNPEKCDWPALRDSIYDFVWGPSQVPVIRELDERFVQLKELYWLPDRSGFRTPDKGLVRLKDRADRPKALALLEKLDGLAAILAEKSFDETALTADCLRSYYLEPLQVSLKFARKQATLEYPEYEFANFELKASEILTKLREEAANAYLADARMKLPPMLDILSKELSGLKDIDPVLETWRRRLERAKTVTAVQPSKPGHAGPMAR